MRSAHISRRAAEAAYDGMDENYDVLAAQAWSAAQLDAVAEETELFMSAAELAAMHDYLHDFRDQRGAGRRQRRAGRSVLRALPTVAQHTATAIEREAA